MWGLEGVWKNAVPIALTHVKHHPSGPTVLTHILVTTGPESSGKTTLATQLSGLLQAPLVTEASREYLTDLYQRKPGTRYTQQDLLEIARMQHAREQQALQANPQWLVCDTDLLVILIWSEVRFGNCDPALLQLFEEALATNQRTYLLCDPGIPWQPDPLRENPQDRDWLFGLYKARLADFGLASLTLAGAEAERLQRVSQHLQCDQHFELQPTLTGTTLTLRPLVAEDFDALYAVASDPLIWEVHPEPARYQKAVFERGFFASALASGSAFVVSENATGRIIGSTRFYEWNPTTREVAIGYTFLARSHWGGAANREMKRLMLDHAFRWAKVAWFHVGATNWRSRRAMEKIGGRLSHEENRVMNGVTLLYAWYRIDAPGK